VKDEIIEEVHKHREEFAAKFNYDIDKMFEYLRGQQEKSGREYVSFSTAKNSLKKEKKTRKAA